MNNQKRQPTKNLATLYNKPYPPPKQWIWAVLTRDNQRIATMKIEASIYEDKVASFKRNGYQVIEDVQP